jgi:hypothetical protein
MPFSPQLWLILAGLFIASNTGLYFKGRWDGAAACDARHAAAQVNQDNKERKTDARRDAEKPVGADRSAKLRWLRQYTRP